MTDKILTISVASYNVEWCLGKCLDSFIGSGVIDDLEILVVNDGSKDGTVALAESYSTRFPENIRLIDKENGGHGSTINASIKAATGKYYKVVDADDWVDAEGIRKLVKALKENDSDVVINPYHFVDADTFEIKSLSSTFNGSTEFGVVKPLKDLIGSVYIQMHALTYRTDVVKKMGPAIDEHCFYVDMEYNFFPLEYVESALCLDFPVYQYRVGSNEQSVSSANMVKRRSQHRQVLNRLIEYYEDKKDELEPTTREVILDNLRKLSLVHYKILFRVEEGSKAEFVSFDKYLKKASSEVYEGPDGFTMKVIRMLRKGNFALYGLVLFCLKIKWKVKGQSNLI